MIAHDRNFQIYCTFSPKHLEISEIIHNFAPKYK